MVHKIRRELRHDLSYEVEPATLDQVEEVLESLAMQTRHAAGITENRRARALRVIDEALAEYRYGTASLPTNETVEAWRDTPARLEQLTTEENAAAEAATTAEARRPYHRRFANFKRAALDATRQLIEARPSRMSPEERDVAFRSWVTALSEAYGMETPAFHWDEDADYGGGGFYQPATHSITMSPNHPSVVTLIHEFRHALQRTGKGAPMVSQDIEVDARAWSLSLYWQVKPRLLERLVREGRVFHITADEL